MEICQRVHRTTSTTRGGATSLHPSALPHAHCRLHIVYDDGEQPGVVHFDAFVSLTLSVCSAYCIVRSFIVDGRTQTHARDKTALTY